MVAAPMDETTHLLPGAEQPAAPASSRSNVVTTIVALCAAAAVVGAVTLSQPSGASAPPAKLRASDEPTMATTDWDIYKVTVPVIGHTGKTVSTWVGTYVAPYLESSDLGCEEHKYITETLNLQIHFVDTPSLERKGTVTCEDMENYWLDLNGNMTEWNTYMHNKVQLFVPDLTGYQKLYEADRVTHMRRLSYLDDGTKMAHLIVSVQGRVFDITGPCEGLNLTGFVEFLDTECPESHRLTHYSSLKAWNSYYETEASTTNVELMFDGKPTPVLVTISSATDSIEASDADGDGRTDLMHFAGGVESTYDTAMCSFKEIEWADLTDMVPMRYVVNPSTTSGDISLTSYLDGIHRQHKTFVDDHIYTWGDNWDHWLDQHIGILTAECGTYNQAMHNYLKGHNRSVGYRYGGGHGQDDDLYNYSYHYYTGYRSNFALEFYVEDCTDEFETGTAPELCSCDVTNDATVYMTKQNVSACNV